jgi:hypothetical protein
MRHWFPIAALAGIALTLLPETGEAFGRRSRNPPCPPPQACPCPPVICCLPVASAASVPTPTTVTIKNKSYRIIPHPDKGYEEEDERKAATVTPPPGAQGSDIPSSDRFEGTARRIAKVNIFNGVVEPQFDTVAKLRTTLQSKSDMKALMIPQTSDSKRVEQEKRNVCVKAYIYAFKKEGDNDYHVILGDAPGTPGLQFLNTEVSGIPVGGTDENRDKLWAVRKAFKDAFSLGNSGPGSYYRPDPPVPVLITGSLFWDVDHENVVVGPADFKPKDAWEIHPISAIEFLEN